MSGGAPSFVPATAPRNGRKLGRKNKLSAHALEILDRLLVDWSKHGARTLKILRLENPTAYARLSLEVATKLVLNESEDLSGPVTITVKWVDPKRSPTPPPPPERPLPPHGPTITPASPAKLLTFHRLSD